MFTTSSPPKSAKMKMFLLAALVADMHLDDAGLADFIARARAFADELLNRETRIRPYP